ncbi:MAG: hypothetical protein Q8J59_07175 [Methylotenera sp.]|nr:hypothetical protein [Methylotenera sp.]MDP2281452.1 hypothetical protein [Methylotenera sp.]MDP3060171.1 hypothetical protein [Methylotenera sp.]
MKQLLLLLALALLMSACGEVSYKRGATVRDLEQAKKSCAKEGDESAQLECLRQQGWMISPANDIDLFAQASVTENQSHAKPVPVSDEMATESSTFAPSPTPAQLSVELKAVAQKDNVIKPKTPQAAPVNDNTKYKISSWWKLGGSAEMMKKDMGTCAATLGAEHQPDTIAQLFTRGFVVCMYQQGWKGLKSS